MNIRRTIALALATAMAALAQAPASKANMAKICANCHTTAPGNLRGNFDNLVLKNNSFQVKIDDATEVLRFDKATLKVQAKETGATLDETLKLIKKGHEVRVEYAEKDGQKVATLVSVKPPVSLAAEETVTLAEVERLVALGPEKGKYFLVDCRPAPRYQEGNIPTAVNLPFPAFDKLVDKLPSDKGALIIYYCSGKTCNMSPGSLRKAQKLGYTNVKVFTDGMPGWYAKHAGVITPKHFSEVFIAKDMPAVILDLRGAQAEQGTLQGAVAVDPAKLEDLLKAFPAAKLKPPVLVVDSEGSAGAVAFAEKLARAGYAGVNVLQGGFKAWQAAGLPVATGKLAAKVSFTPKLRPGSISAVEFTKLASVVPAQRQVTILDVRNADETKQGVIPGAIVIPEPQLAGRLGEVPRDKRVLVHCSTGMRAEMAFHLLKEKGYQAAFLNGEITILDTGEFIAD